MKLKIADAGITALDDGSAEVAVAFSSNPLLSRPDLLVLRDDKRMISPDHVVPVVSTSLLKRYGPALRRPLNAASRLLSTLQLRGLNQQVIDGRLPEAVGGEFIDANGLGGDPARRRAGPRIVVGFQEFDENETLAYMYAAALRGAGFRVTVRSAGGFRARRRSPRCGADASGCGPATRARCAASSAAGRSRARWPASAPSRSRSRRRRTATALR